MPDLINTVAKAISRTMEAHHPKRITRGADQDYEECQAGCRYEPGDWSAHISKLLAQAAIDALGLAEIAGALSRADSLVSLLHYRLGELRSWYEPLVRPAGGDDA